MVGALRGTGTALSTLASTHRPRIREEAAMNETYTHTTWRVKPGMEDEFVQRWGEWIEWSHRQGLGARARLLRDVERPGTFVSFGPWASIDAVKSWRSAEGYHDRVARLQEVVESFEPHTLELVAER
jgi:heme-degrading monooxygenase HmoA